MIFVVLFFEVIIIVLEDKSKMLCNNIGNNIFFSGKIESGFCWNVLTKQRIANPNSLEGYGYKVYSQNDEDGIIHEIFSRIGVTNRRFVEFGVQNGLESNCHLLLFYGWEGLWIEGSAEYCDEIITKFRPVMNSGQLKLINAFINKENINKLISSENYCGEIDLLSIDIDGNDYYIWEVLDVVNPRCVIIEYNGKFPPDLNWKQAYDAGHIWGGSDWHGASLKALEMLGNKKGYSLVGTNLRGCNAFFVRDDLVDDKFLAPYTAETHYNPLRLSLEFVSNHPAQFCLVNQKENMGLKNYVVECDDNITENNDGVENVVSKHHDKSVKEVFSVIKKRFIK